MHRSLLIAAAALALTACNDGNDAADNAAQGGGPLTADDIGSNDTTAIDAATAEDANMAADVQIDANLLNELGNDANAAANATSANNAN